MSVHRIKELPADLLALALTQQGLVTGPQVGQFLDDRQFPAAVRHGQLVKLWWSVYCLPNLSDDLPTLLAGADMALGRPATVCLHTAGQMYGFDVGRDTRAGNRKLHVLAPAQHHSKSPRLSLHRLTLLDELEDHDGRAVTSGTETAFTVAARMPDRYRALAVLDAALRAGATTRDRLSEYSPRARYRGAPGVRALIGQADPRAESPPETWLRLACLDFGLPAPEPQIWVRGADGINYRMDLGWEEAKVALEYDGVEFHTGAHLERDRRKLNALIAAGWAVYSMTNDSFWNSRDRVLSLVAAEIARRSSPSGRRRSA